MLSIFEISIVQFQLRYGSATTFPSNGKLLFINSITSLFNISSFSGMFNSTTHPINKVSKLIGGPRGRGEEMAGSAVALVGQEKISIYMVSLCKSPSVSLKSSVCGKK